MGSRAHNGPASHLVALPWPVSVAFGAVAFLTLRWILPGILPDRGPLSELKAHLEPLAWIVLAAFCVLAALAALRAVVARLKHRARPQEPVPQPRPMRPVPGAEGRDQHLRAPRRLAAPAPPGEWSTDALRMLEWKRFELLCARYYEAVGFVTETLAAGADGGIDIKLFRVDPDKPLAIIQCKAWNTQPVGVKEIRELLGVMVHERVARGIFVTTGSYSPDALAFGAANPIQLLDGAAFTNKILGLPLDKQKTLLDFAFEGDYRTPTCASCGIKMRPRDSKRGPFWGCARYPRCKTTLAMPADRVLEEANEAG